MTRAHEENWAYEPVYDRLTFRNDVTKNEYEGVHWSVGDSDRVDVESRGRLAACAPEMARLLLKLESTSCRSDMVECPMCGASEYSNEPGVPVEHDPDCEWVAVLRKAGVR
jgi:hypothetical protein